MKKIISVLLVLAVAISVCSCKKKQAEETDAKPEKKFEQPVAENEFYKKMTTSGERPVAVMIDNDSGLARPQSGIEDAYAVYEIKVEGSATRLMALFLESEMEKIGPVRSSRHYFLDYVMEHGALYAHCGFSPQAANDISALGINNINEIASNNGKNFYRDYSGRAPHNLYASMPELIASAKEMGYKTEKNTETVFTYNTEDKPLDNGTAASEIVLPYNGAYGVAYTYNQETKLYERFVNGAEHTSRTSGKVISVKNILIYKVANYSIDDVGRQNIENIGSGEGFYVTEGKYIPINWSKTGRSAKTEYKTESGEPLVINPGNTFVQIMPVTSEITIS